MIPAGILLPVEVLHSHGYAVLASFVAVNTMLFLGLSIAKMLPVPRLPWRGGTRRGETRSIHPDEPA